MSDPLREGLRRIGDPATIIDDQEKRIAELEARVAEAYARAVSDVVESREQLASAFRDWLHETGRGDCNAGVDECPDWPLAYQLADIAIGKFEKWAADRKAGT